MEFNAKNKKIYVSRYASCDKSLSRAAIASDGCLHLAATEDH
jgi:hypothetical protein